MKAEEFEQIVKNILKAEIKFDGHINKIMDNLEPNKVESIISWIKECKLGSQKPNACKNFRKIIAFIYKSNDNSLRGILTKVKNSYFIELFLDKHKYYDLKRRYLGL